jgi:hypothetical protein
MTADSDDTIPERTDLEADDDDLVRDEEGRAEDGESLMDRLRGTGVGVEDPNIVGDPTPGPVDAEIAEDEPPVV